MITSTGTEKGAGIGSGQGGACGNITITLKQGDTKEKIFGKNERIYKKLVPGNLVTVEISPGMNK